MILPNRKIDIHESFADNLTTSKVIMIKLYKDVDSLLIRMIDDAGVNYAREPWQDDDDITIYHKMTIKYLDPNTYICARNSLVGCVINYNDIELIVTCMDDETTNILVSHNNEYKHYYFSNQILTIDIKEILTDFSKSFEVKIKPTNEDLDSILRTINLCPKNKTL